jgi:putative ABC transport system permease protein
MMTKLTLRNLRAHKRRFVGTFLAVVFGVAFFSGVFALTATINKTFDDLFSNGNRGTDAYVRSSSKIEVSGNGPGTFTQRGHVDASLVGTIQGVDGVKDAKPFIQGIGRIVTASGEALGNPDNGPPVFAEAWIDDPALNGWSVVDGRGPAADGEVVIDRKAAKDGNVHVGDHVTVQSTTTIQATVVGIATYAGEDSSGGTTYAAFTVEQAERDVIGAPGQIDGVKVVGDGISQQQLVERIDKVLPSGTEAITGSALIKELQDDIQNQFLGFFNIVFLIFAGIAVVVAVFSIYNTFSIIVAQRTREMALLRAVGASRQQILRSVLFEALVIGLIASIIGVAAGAGLALLLREALHAAGFGLPASSFVFGVDTITIGLLIGVGVSLFAGLIPAVKATRIPPLAALREVAVERTRASRPRVVVGVLISLLGVVNLISGASGNGDNPSASAGLGALFLLAGVIVLGPVAAGPVSGAVGSVLPRVRGVVGRIARDNAMRNPRRTSGSAVALMIGVGIVALFTIFGSSIQATINKQIDTQFAGDLVVGQGFGTGITPDLAKELAQQPQVEAAAGLRFGVASISDKGEEVLGVDPATLQKIMHVNVLSGDLSTLDMTHFAVNETQAKDHDWSVGSTVDVKFVDGKTDKLTVGAIYKKERLLGPFVMTSDLFTAHRPDSTDALVTVKLKSGVDAAQAKADLKPIVDKYARGLTFQTRAEFADDQAGQILQVLAFVYVMLAVAIIISLMGIANTLSLSINERTREIGLSRAVGMLRPQLRAAVRWEGALIALFGTIGGLGIGIAASWAVVQSTGENGLTYRLPIVGLVILAILGGLAGIISALLPARRAGRMDILAAIAHE